jgi:hypothetical protein
MAASEGIDEIDGGKAGPRPVPIDADVRLVGLTLLVDPPSATLEYGIELDYGFNTDCS